MINIISIIHTKEENKMSEFGIKITENTKFICNFADEDGKLSVTINGVTKTFSPD